MRIIHFIIYVWSEERPDDRLSCRNPGGGLSRRQWITLQEYGRKCLQWSGQEFIMGILTES